MHHISVADNILPALCAKFTGSARAGFSIALNKIIKSHDFGTNKAAFKIIMNNRCSLWRFPSTLNCPGADLFYSGSQVTYKPERMIAMVNYLVESAFRLAKR